MTSIQEEIRGLLARRQMVVLVGSGVSVAATMTPTGPAHAASWKGLLTAGLHQIRVLGLAEEKWIERLRDDIEGDLIDLLSAAERIGLKLGAPTGGDYRRWLRETIGELQTTKTDILQALHNLQAPLFTTNYDHLLEKLTGHPPITWQDETRIQRVLRGEEQAIVHLHGEWQRPETVVLGIRDYEHILRHAPVQDAMKALAQYRSILFVGCGDGLEDPNFSVWLKWRRQVLVQGEQRCYRLCRESERLALLAIHRGRDGDDRILPVAYGNDYKELVPFLQSLAPGQPLGGPGSLLDIVGEVVDQGTSAGVTALRAGKADKALLLFQDARKKAELAAKPQQIAQTRLREAQAHLILGDMDASEKLLISLETDRLLVSMEDSDLNRLSSLWVHIGNNRAAKKILPERETIPITIALQRLELVEGRIPTQLHDVPDLQIRAASIELDKGHYQRAVQRVQRWLCPPLELEPALRAGQICFLALYRTVYNFMDSQEPIPELNRLKLIMQLEASIRWLAEQDVDPKIKQEINLLRRDFLYLTADPDQPQLPENAVIQQATQGERQETDYQKAVLNAVEHIGKKEWAEARPHATYAYHVLPSRGNALLLADCCVMSGDMDTATPHLERLSDSMNIEILELRARHAEVLNRPMAIPLWEQILPKLGPSKSSARIHLHIADLLWEDEHRLEAAQKAWGCFNTYAEHLGVPELAQVAHLQVHSGLVTEEVQKRHRTIADFLLPLSKTNLTAERLRTHLVLGGAGDVPPDWKRLQDAGVVQPLTTSTLLDMMQQDRKQKSVAIDLYHKNKAPFSMIIEVCRLSVAQWVEGLSRRDAPVLRPPVLISPPLLSLPCEVVVGHLELALIDALDVWKPMHQKGITLLLPQAEWVRIRKEADQPFYSWSTNELRRHQELMIWLSGQDAWIGETEDEITLAVNRSLVYVVWKPESMVTPAALIRCLEKAGKLSNNNVSQARLPDGPDISPCPTEVLLDPVTTVTWWERGELPIVAAAARIRVGPETRRFLRERIAELEPQVRADERAVRLLQAVSTAIASGLLRIVPPILTAQGEPEHQRVTLDLLEPWAIVMQSAERRFLCADGVLATLKKVFFEEMTVSQRVHPTPIPPDHQRVLTLPTLIQSCVTDSMPLLKRLIEWGFVDALTEDVLISLSKDYHGLSGERPQSLLTFVEDVMELCWKIDQWEPCVVLADSYAGALYVEYEQPMSGTPDSGLLLSRALRLGEKTQGVFLQLAVEDLMGRTLFYSHIDSDNVRRLWTDLNAHALRSDRFRAACERALVNAIRTAAALPAAARQQILGSLVLMIGSLSGGKRGLSRLHQIALAVLSVDWPVSPLDHLWQSPVTKEGIPVVENKTFWSEFLKDAVSGFQEKQQQVEAFFFYNWGEMTAFWGEAWLPPEAVLLRLSPELLTEHLHYFLAWLQPHDGRLVPLLHALAQEPANPKRRQAFAEAAVLSPWRFFQADPAWIETWTLPIFRPLDLAGLCAMLHEPPSEPRFTEGTARLHDILLHRPWQNASFELFWLNLIPGDAALFAAASAMQQSQESPTATIQNAWEALEYPHEQAIGYLCASIWILRMAAAQHPHQSLNGQRIDLREVLPERIAAVLDVLRQEPPPDSHAAHEASWLRTCDRIVRSMGTLPDRQRIWLAWRLYAWLMMESGSRSPQEMQAVHDVMERMAPEVKTSASRIDPGAMKDIRNLRVLAVLNAMQPLPVDVALIEVTGPNPILRQILVEEASRSLSDEERQVSGDTFFGDKLCSSPELAMHILMGSDPRAFADLPMEARSRWIDRLEPPSLNEWLVLYGVGAAISKLQGVERDRLHALLPRFRNHPESMIRYPALLALVGLFLEGYPVKDQVWSWINADRQEPWAPEVFAPYLVALSVHNQADLEGAVKAMEHQIRADNRNPGPFVLGLAQVLVHSRGPGRKKAQTLFRRYLKQEPYRSDPAFLMTAATLGYKQSA